MLKKGLISEVVMFTCNGTFRERRWQLGGRPLPLRDSCRWTWTWLAAVGVGAEAATVVVAAAGWEPTTPVRNCCGC